MNNASISALLEAKKIDLERRLEGAKRDLGKQYSQDFAEQATERENDEVLMRIREETEEELRQVKLALKSIDSGDYGTCASCGEEINPKRMEIMPYATMCSNCAT